MEPTGVEFVGGAPFGVVFGDEPETNASQAFGMSASFTEVMPAPTLVGVTLTFRFESGVPTRTDGGGVTSVNVPARGRALLRRPVLRAGHRRRRRTRAVAALVAVGDRHGLAAREREPEDVDGRPVDVEAPLVRRRVALHRSRSSRARSIPPER